MPRTTDTESLLQTRIEAFVEEISAIVREAAVEAVQGALLSGGSATSVSRPKKAKAAKKTAGRKPAKKAKSGRRVRRSAEDLEELGSSFLAHVKSNPGQRLEEIGKALRIDTIELKRPVQLLMEAKQLRTEGQRRGTKYFAGKATAKRKATKTRKKAAPKKTASKKRATLKKVA